MRATKHWDTTNMNGSSCSTRITEHKYIARQGPLLETAHDMTIPLPTTQGRYLHQLQ